MFDYFDKEKADFLGKKDKSNKGCIDKDALEIVNEINSKKDYYTTSSCSGRIVLLEKLSRKKNESNWIFSKHGKVTCSEIIRNLKGKNIKNEVWFKQEPLILHARCRDTNAAKRLLDAARKIFKRAGVISLSERKIIVEIIGSERIDAIVADKDFFADENYLKQLVKYANENFAENKKKSERFLKIVRRLG